MDKTFTPYRLIDALAVLASFFVGLLLSLMLYFFKAIFRIESISASLHIPYDILSILVEYLVAAFVVLIIYLVIFRRYKLNWTTFGFRPLSIKKTLSYIIISFVLTFAIWIAVAPFIIVFFPTIDLGESQEIFDPQMHVVAQGLLIFYAIIIGPFIEEIVFRGVLFPAFAQKTNIILGLMLSTLIWSLLHFQLNVIIFTFIFGIILGYMYYKTKSLWPSYITHVLKNLMAVIAIYLFGLF
ncbi:MAG: type II CAAX endopeptidase family protein [Patescibacteria group bacterium]